MMASKHNVMRAVEERLRLEVGSCIGHLALPQFLTSVQLALHCSWSMQLT